MHVCQRRHKYYYYWEINSINWAWWRWMEPGWKDWNSYWWWRTDRRCTGDTGLLKPSQISWLTLHHLMNCLWSTEWSYLYRDDDHNGYITRLSIMEYDGMSLQWVCFLFVLVTILLLKSIDVSAMIQLSRFVSPLAVNEENQQTISNIKSNNYFLWSSIFSICRFVNLVCFHQKTTNYKKWLWKCQWGW